MLQTPQCYCFVCLFKHLVTVLVRVPREIEQIGCVYVYSERNIIKVLAHMNMVTGKSKSTVYGQAQDPWKIDAPVERSQNC